MTRPRSPEIEKSCNTRVAEFCKRYQIQEGFLKAKADENAAKMCGVAAASVKAAQCPKAAQAGSLDFLGAYCPVESKPLAQEHCTQRDYTSRSGRQVLRGSATATSRPTASRSRGLQPQSATEKATDTVEAGRQQGHGQAQGVVRPIDVAALSSPSLS